MKASQWLGLLILTVPFAIMGYSMVASMGWKEALLTIAASLFVMVMFIIGVGLLSGDIG